MKSYYQLLMRYAVMTVVTIMMVTCATATFEGWTSVTSKHFVVRDMNTENTGDWMPSDYERSKEIKGTWQTQLSLYRVVDASPELQKQVADQAKPYWFKSDLTAMLVKNGVTREQLVPHEKYIYTLQLYAFREKYNVKRFISRLPFKKEDNDDEYMYDDATRIYEKTPKDFRFAYDPDYRKLGDPLYITKSGNLSRVRYGFYENTADAERDAAEWQKRYQVTASVTRVAFTTQLVNKVLWGDLPGVFENRDSHM